MLSKFKVLHVQEMATKGESGSVLHLTLLWHGTPYRSCLEINFCNTTKSKLAMKLDSDSNVSQKWRNRLHQHFRLSQQEKG